MRLASFNVRGGRDDHGVADPAVLRRAVRALGADVLALQEVDRGQERSGRVDQVALVAGALGVGGARHVRAEPTLRGADGSSYGIALVSRVPVARWLRVELPRWPLPVPVLPPHPLRRWRAHGIRRIADEPRVALAAVLDVGSAAPVRSVVTTHLSFVPLVNVVQLRHLARAVVDLPGPVLVLGDLNLTGALPPAVLGPPWSWQVLGGPATFPAACPRVRLDRALLAPRAAARPRAVSAVRAGESDHRALVVQM